MAMRQRRYQTLPDRIAFDATPSIESNNKKTTYSERATGRSATEARATTVDDTGETGRGSDDCFKRLQHQTGTPLPPVKELVQDGVTHLMFDCHDQGDAGVKLAHAMGTTDAALLKGILQQLAEAARRDGAVDAAHVNFGLGVIRGAAPRDPIELMLITQMQAVHVAAMTSARRLAGSTTVDVQDSNATCMNKCMRTFAAQVEALKRHRAATEQKVVVQHQHVTVSSNQAVVDIRQGEGDE